MPDTLKTLTDSLQTLPVYAHEVAQFLLGWSLTRGIRIVPIILGMWVLIKLARVIGKKIIRIAEDDDPATENERERRTRTLVQIFNFAVKVVVFSLGTISIMKELEFDIAPVLAGAGIIGLAIGFGSQSLVKDIVSGFFLIMENQIRVGDVVRIGDVSGLVEKITLRIVVLRDIEGVVHAIPNGDIKILSNMTYGWSLAKLDIGVAYKEDVDRVIGVLKELSSQIYKEEKYGKVILEEPTILGIDSLEDSAVTVRMLFKTKPLQQWGVARDFRRRVKNEFDRLGIELPFPHRTIYVRQDHAGMWKSMAAQTIAIKLNRRWIERA